MANHTTGWGTKLSPALTLLLWSAALTFIQMLLAVSGATLQVGLPKLAGNREGLPRLTGWAGRAQRAHYNMLENMVVFATLVVIAELTDKDNAMIRLGAQLFFWGRLAYAIIYVAGLPWARTAVWGVSVVGMILIFSQLVI
jgi:uncharacterized MAPEG superfamily protein